jgi:hypothetical protein
VLRYAGIFKTKAFVVGSDKEENDVLNNPWWPDKARIVQKTHVIDEPGLK